MSKYQAKLTEKELKAAFNNVAYRITNEANIDEDDFERLNYLGKRLIKIQKGEPEINNEPEAKAGGW